MFSDKKALLLDMNSTFMFGEDNFNITEDFSIFYHKTGGLLTSDQINRLIRSVYDEMSRIYPLQVFRHKFPSVRAVLERVSTVNLSEKEKSKIIKTFAFHEIGYIPREYIKILHQLKQRFTLALVIDIWSPKASWCTLFQILGIDYLFSASSYSSDHGIVKPSPKPFELVLNTLNIDPDEALVVGDSIRRDLGGANSAGVDCVLVGGKEDPRAIGCFSNLIEFSQSLEKT